MSLGFLFFSPRERTAPGTWSFSMSCMDTAESCCSRLKVRLHIGHASVSLPWQDHPQTSTTVPLRGHGHHRPEEEAHPARIRKYLKFVLHVIYHSPSVSFFTLKTILSNWPLPQKWYRLIQGPELGHVISGPQSEPPAFISRLSCYKVSTLQVTALFLETHIIRYENWAKNENKIPIYLLFNMRYIIIQKVYS